jgi:hypothetical protein
LSLKQTFQMISNGRRNGQLGIIKMTHFRDEPCALHSTSEGDATLKRMAFVCTSQTAFYKMEFALFIHMSKLQRIQWLDSMYSLADLIYFY